MSENSGQHAEVPKHVSYLFQFLTDSSIQQRMFAQYAGQNQPFAVIPRKGCCVEHSVTNSGVHLSQFAAARSFLRCTTPQRIASVRVAAR